jgi:hypothetical protein
MLMFLGFDLELRIEVVVTRRDWPTVYSARDLTDRQWLIVQVEDDPDHLAWLCAPASARAIQAVLTGHASPFDVVRHSQTGTVELVRIDHGQAVPERCLLCSDLPRDLPRQSDCELAVAA